VTPDQSYAEHKKLGLSPTAIPTIFIDRDDMTHPVPLPYDKTPEQRAEIVAMRKFLMGVGPDPLA
jgi:hypothetical protein